MSVRDIDKASIVQNGLTRDECEAFFALLRAAQIWRDTMVWSNTPSAGYPTDDPNGSKYWAAIKNHNGNLVVAVDNINALMGRAP